jgi:hypothetical protein
MLKKYTKQIVMSRKFTHLGIAVLDSAAESYQVSILLLQACLTVDKVFIKQNPQEAHSIILGRMLKSGSNMEVP